jgi:hypothetical protein
MTCSRILRSTVVFDVAGRGATVPFLEQEAESAATNGTATITFPATSQRYLRLTFTGNTAWPAGQVSEFEVYTS